MWSLLKKHDFQEAQRYLQNNSPFTCPMYGNFSAAGFTYKPKAMRSGIYYIFRNRPNGQILGMLAGFNDGNVMVHMSQEHGKEEIMSIISSIPCHSIWRLDGRKFDKTRLSDCINMNMDERVLNVMIAHKERVSIQAVNDAEFIRIDKRILIPSYFAFIRKCLWEGFGFKSNPWDIRKRIRERTKLEPYWFLSKNNNYVAQAHVQAMTRDHGYIGGVCTPRAYRRMGYAKEIMGLANNFVYNAGRTPALAVSSNNKAACDLYENLGFKTIGTTVVYMQERDFKGDENE